LKIVMTARKRISLRKELLFTDILLTSFVLNWLKILQQIDIFLHFIIKKGNMLKSALGNGSGWMSRRPYERLSGHGSSTEGRGKRSLESSRF
jgi:hypothetical protein